MINAWDTIFPIITVRVDEQKKKAVLARFLGCGFFINDDGHFLTCAHVIDEAEDGEELAVQNMKDENRYKISVVAKDTARDMAICKIERKSFFRMPFDLEPKVCGVDVSSFGLTLHEVKDGDVGLDMSYFKGYISAIPKIIPSFPALSRTYLLSFPVLKGFSGAPLLRGEKVCGMLYSNKTSTIVDHHIKEVKDGTETFSEKVARIYEVGMAHPIEQLLEYLKTNNVQF